MHSIKLNTAHRSVQTAPCVLPQTKHSQAAHRGPRFWATPARAQDRFPRGQGRRRSLHLTYICMHIHMHMLIHIHIYTYVYVEYTCIPPDLSVRKSLTNTNPCLSLLGFTLWGSGVFHLQILFCGGTSWLRWRFLWGSPRVDANPVATCISNT